MNLLEPTFYITLLLMLALVIPAVFFLITQQTTLTAIKTKNRRLIPTLVWFQFIPFLGQIWQFFVVVLIANSIRNEFKSRGEDSVLGIDAQAVEHYGKRPTRGIGIAYCTLSLTLIFFNLFGTFDKTGHDPVANMIPFVLFLATTVCWIIYWVQLAAMKRKILSPTF